ncbi:ArsR/SmtB family transcription factor [Cellulomonas sp. Leaf395]|uniref:ArsR/SmtB family transcription factor n=1 Tax=Cellulomonas sp. Leaf395 TaxID=1736362 RepID=UPI0006FEB967|nr:metalloregulator ArsR/SmtB family transcription factor [Cellulomonas sp. Leaf395]KQT02015.1 ArsR family transcriptional regulator [Cellulomonas sp. Leaf395]
MDEDLVFKALADTTRRHLLDQLYTRDGRTLTELEEGLDMTRFGVMKHLKVLEEAGLVVTRRSGREKLHFLNAVPIQLIHERWIDKYDVLGAERLHALTDLKSALESTMTTQTDTATTTVLVNRIWIKADTATVWKAITSPEWNARYGYKSPSTFELTPGGAFTTLPSADMVAYGTPADQPILDGEVLEVVEGSRLVLTWRTLWDDEARAEGFTRLTYEIEERGAGITQLTLVHDVTGAPRTASLISGDLPEFGGGWPQILSDLKTLLETGASLES